MVMDDIVGLLKVDRVPDQRIWSIGGIVVHPSDNRQKNMGRIGIGPWLNRILESLLNHSIDGESLVAIIDRLLFDVFPFGPVDGFHL